MTNDNKNAAGPEKSRDQDDLVVALLPVAAALLDSRRTAGHGPQSEAPSLAEMWRQYNALYVGDCYERAQQIMLLVMNLKLDVPFAPALAERWYAASKLTCDPYQSAQRRGLREAMAVLVDEGAICPGLAKALLADIERYDPEVSHAAM